MGTMIILKARFLGGTEIEKAVEEAVKLAIRLDCAVGWSHNGIVMTVWPSSNQIKKVEEFYREVRESGRGKVHGM